MCSKCGVIKPAFAFYRNDKKVNNFCIKCTSIAADAAKSLQQGNIEPLMKLNNVSTYNYYLVTFFDASFNEYNATINARTHLKLDSSFFDIKGFAVRGERVFWEMSISPMSREEYYWVQDSEKLRGRDCLCPNLRIANRMSKKDTREVMYEFMSAIYKYHKNC